MEQRLVSGRIAGILFLVAMVSSLAGAALIESALGDPQTSVGLGVALELVDAIAVLGIAVVVLPFLRRRSEGVAVGYLGLRILESISLTAAALVPVSIRSFASASAGGAAYDPASVAALLTAVRGDIHGVLVPLFFMLGSVLLYGVLFRFRLVPRFISVWGLIAVVALLIGNVLPVPASVGFVFAAPIILNEIFLGIWLIVKGFMKGSEN